MKRNRLPHNSEKKNNITFNYEGNSDVVQDANGVYSKDGKTMLYPYVHDGVVFVKKGVQNLSYSLADDPDKAMKPVRKIVFEEGVEKISEGWGGLYDKTSNEEQHIDISLPSTIWKVKQNAFGDMVGAINHVYVPRRWAGDIKKHLPSNLRPKVRIDRIFYTPLSDWKRNPLGHFLGFWGSANQGCMYMLLSLFYIILILILCFIGYLTYLKTFLWFHINVFWSVITVIGLVVLADRYSEKRGKAKDVGKHKKRNERGAYYGGAVDWVVLLMIIVGVTCSSFFILNDKLGGSQEQSKGQVLTIITSRKYHSRRVEVNLDNTDVTATIGTAGYMGHDLGRYYPIYYHDGFFGLPVLDEVCH